MSVHVIGIVKGAVEGNPTAHLGSLLASAHHLLVAERLGLVDDGGSIYTATPTVAGREFYKRHQLAGLPPGRAYLWPPELIAAALAELEG